MKIRIQRDDNPLLLSGDRKNRQVRRGRQITLTGVNGIEACVAKGAGGAAGNALIQEEFHDAAGRPTVLSSRMVAAYSSD